MSAELRELALQGLPRDAQPFARRLATLGDTRRSHEGAVEDSMFGERRRVANAFFEDAADIQDQIREETSAHNAHDIVNTFMLNLLYADRYGRMMTGEPIPNVTFHISQIDDTDDIHAYSANRVTVTIANPDSTHGESITFATRINYLQRQHNQTFPSMVSIPELGSMLRDVDAEITPEKPQEAFYRMALEIRMMDHARIHIVTEREVLDDMRERKVAYLDAILSDRMRQLDHRGEAGHDQTIRLGSIEAYAGRVPGGARSPWYDLLELQISHPVVPGKMESIHFIPPSDESYYTEEQRMRLLPKIARYGFDYTGTRVVDR